MTLPLKTNCNVVKAPVRPSLWPNKFILVKGDKVKSRDTDTAGFSCIGITDEICLTCQLEYFCRQKTGGREMADR